MPILVQIGGHKPLLECKYPELIASFVDVGFFKFMEHGRSGLQLIAADFVDSLMEWLDHNGQVRFTSLSQRSQVRADVMLQVEQLLIDGFIRMGSHGLREGFMSAHMVVLHAAQRRER